MYTKRYVYICDGCGKIEFPREVQCSDLIDVAGMPDGWERAGGKHLCSSCKPSRYKTATLRYRVIKSADNRK